MAMLIDVYKRQPAGWAQSQTRGHAAPVSAGIHRQPVRTAWPAPAPVSYTHLFIGQHRTIPALRLKHRSGSCGTASALPKCSIMSGDVYKRQL